MAKKTDDKAPTLKKGDQIRIARGARVDWPTMKTSVPVQAGRVFRVVPDPDADSPLANRVPIGVGSGVVRLSAAQALIDNGDAEKA